MHLLTSWIYFLKLSSHLRLGFLSTLFPSGFLHTHVLYTSFLSPIRAKCLAHLIIHDFINWIIFGGQYRLWSSLLCSLLYCALTSPLWDPNTFLSTLFSNTISLHASLNVRHQVSHPNDTTDIIIFLYILIFIFLDVKLEDKTVCKRKEVRNIIRNVAQISLSYESNLEMKIGYPYWVI